MKAPALGFELLQWFVDELLSLQCRADSVLLLEKARELRDQLLAAGVQPEALPKVDRHWLFRWRRQFRISHRAITTQFKVPFSVACRRVGVMLSNVFRLRRLWTRCHGDAPMRFLSLDQKPSWFNNAGLKGTYARRGTKVIATKSDHAGTRQRYTLLTFVQSAPPPDGQPPPLAILFKGSRAAPRLRAQLDAPPWLLLQFQERGSYRAEDVVDALEWSLPAARAPEESMIIMLDWFAAHLSASVAEVVRRKGHILLLHGGGVTGAEQVNDTHLHALVQRRMEELETREMYHQRRDDPSKVARLTRQLVVDLAREMWLSLDHSRIAADGYAQTGPLLPDGAGDEALYFALRPFWEKLDGARLRAEAVEFVDGMLARGEITSWSDAHLLVEEHIPHHCVDEGLEGVPWTTGDDTETSSDGSGEEGGDGDDAGDAGGGVACRATDGAEDAASTGLALAPVGSASGSSGDAPSTSGAVLPGGVVGALDDAPPTVGGAGVPEWAGICDDDEFQAACEIVADRARRTRDDVLLRHILARQKQSATKRRSSASGAGAHLRALATADRTEALRNRAEQQELKRRAEMHDLRARVEVEESRARAADARRAALEAARGLRDEEDQRRRADALRRADSVWLQKDYPLQLGRRLLAWRDGLQEGEAKELQKHIRLISETSRPTRTAEVPEFWETTPSLTYPISTELGIGTRRVVVRATKDFEWWFFGGRWKDASPHDCSHQLTRVIERLAPGGSALFRQRYTARLLLDQSEGILEKAFVHAVVLLSKWLGRTRFPAGVHDWPPARPTSAASSSSTALAPASEEIHRPCSWLGSMLCVRVVGWRPGRA